MSDNNWPRYTTHALRVMLAEYRKRKYGKVYVEGIEKELKARGEECQPNA